MESYCIIWIKEYVDIKISEANQNFSKVARMVDENGVAILSTK